ncbi:MAG: tetratricopeptide repeat protein [Candidatus Aminicenantes bacterium]|nr:MAG: tetratricopeptide repeat protein [Candidatus Aminicenantes bacterium]
MKFEKILILLATSLFLTFCATSQSKVESKKVERENDPQYQYEKAIVAMNYGLVDEAIKYLNEALALDPTHYESYKLLGIAHFKKKNLLEAASAYKKCLELNPDLSEVHNDLGFIYQELDFLDKAEEEYKKAYAMDSNHNASFNLAKLYLGQDKLELALDYVQKSIQKNARASAVYNLQGVILNKMGRLLEAIMSFQSALKISPNEIIIRINLGIAYINNREFEKARILFENVLPHVKDQSLKDKINEYLKLIKDRVKK